MAGLSRQVWGYLCVIHPQVFVVSFPHSAITKAVAEMRQSALEAFKTPLQSSREFAC